MPTHMAMRLQLLCLLYWCSCLADDIKLGEGQQSQVSTYLPSGKTAANLELLDHSLEASGLAGDVEVVENITAQLGSSVFLPCQTHHSLERVAPQVSWIRKRDWHILTSGTKPYTKEERFAVHHPEGSTTWTLAIKYVQLDDAGTYECQIVAGTGRVSQLVHLNVVVPRAVIPGNGEYHVETGSTIALDCFIEESPVAPQYIFWFHNSKMINYDRERGGVSVHIDTGPKVRSRLSVTDARESDSGNYTCAAANTEAASITVYITAANKIAAIQPRAVDSQSVVRASLPLVFTSSLALVLYCVFAAAQEVTCHHVRVCSVPCVRRKRSECCFK